jgi:hypothetical protein
MPRLRVGFNGACHDGNASPRTPRRSGEVRSSPHPPPRGSGARTCYRSIRQGWKSDVANALGVVVHLKAPQAPFHLPVHRSAPFGVHHSTTPRRSFERCACRAHARIGPLSRPVPVAPVLNCETCGLVRIEPGVRRESRDRLGSRQLALRMAARRAPVARVRSAVVSMAGTRRR